MALTVFGSQNYCTNHFAIPAHPIETMTVSISLDARIAPMYAVGNPTLSTHASDGRCRGNPDPRIKLVPGGVKGEWTMVQQAISGDHLLTPNIALCVAKSPDGDLIGYITQSCWMIIDARFDLQCAVVLFFFLVVLAFFFASIVPACLRLSCTIAQIVDV
ncbi:hypothetical protein BJX96DRAFT_32241 [Aspergillus floccosus]